MKELIKIISAILSCVMFCLCGCVNSEDSGKEKLYISVYKAGYGIAWLKAISEAYEEKHPNVKIVYKGNPAMEQTSQSALESENKDAIADIFSCIDYSNYYNNVINDRLECLDELYNDTMDDGTTFESTFKSEVVESLEINGSSFSVPWFIDGAGLIYNVGMFEEYGWAVPKTMDELYSLCDKINIDTGISNTNVCALGYCGGIADGYASSLFSNLQYRYGGESFYKTFNSEQNPDVYKNDARYESYYAIGRLLNGETSNSGKKKPWVLPGSDGFDHIAIEREFIYGHCAIMIGGIWFKNETSEILKDYPNFRASMMETPTIKSDATTKNFDCMSGTMLVIPKLAKNKELAKDFLKFMSTKRMLKLFVENNSGSPRACNYDDIDLKDLDEWSQSILKVYNNCYLRFSVSSNEFLRTGKLKNIMANNGEICSAFVSSTGLVKSQSEISKIANDMCEIDYSIAKKFYEALS